MKTGSICHQRSNSFTVIQQRMRQGKHITSRMKILCQLVQRLKNRWLTLNKLQASIAHLLTEEESPSVISLKRMEEFKECTTVKQRTALIALLSLKFPNQGNYLKNQELEATRTLTISLRILQAKRLRVFLLQIRILVNSCNNSPRSWTSTLDSILEVKEQRLMELWELIG